jgi:hypothetical protein
VVIQDLRLIQLLLRRSPVRVPVFSFDGIVFTLLKAHEDIDYREYELRWEDLILTVCFYGADASNPYGPASNLDFVNFMWREFELLNCLCYAVTVLPRDNDWDEPRLMYLEHHRSNSDRGLLNRNVKVAFGSYNVLCAILCIVNYLRLVSVLSALGNHRHCWRRHRMWFST